MDISLLNGMFNWTMTYKTTSDFYLPYGRFHQVSYRRWWIWKEISVTITQV